MNEGNLPRVGGDNHRDLTTLSYNNAQDPTNAWHRRLFSGLNVQDDRFFQSSNTSASAPSTSVSSSTAIASAPHDLLLRLGNAAYSNLHMNFLQAKCELEAQRKVAAQLNDIINTLANAQPSVTSTAQRISNQSESMALTIPQAPEPYTRDDYPDVPFWHETEWTSYSDKQRDGGNNVTKLHFLTDEDGDPISEKRIREMTEHAKQAWTQLYYHRLDPASWKKKSEDAMRYFNTIMKSKFLEFQYCDGDWKVERFAIVKYPDWNRNIREKGGLSRARPSKRKADESYNKSSHDRHKKKVKSKPMPPPTPPTGDTQVIDLAVDDAATAVTTTTNTATEVIDLAVDSAATAAVMTTTKTATAADMIITDFPSDSILPASSPVPDLPLPPVSPPLTTMLPRGAREIPPIPDLPAESTADTVSLPPTSSPPTMLPGLSAESTLAPSPENGTITSTSKDGQTSAGDGIEHRSSRHRRIDPLAGLQIQKPSIQIPETVMTATGHGDQLAKTSSKKGKLMVASETLLSARNLFAIDYLVDHSCTTAEFSKVWNVLDTATKKKYEALSRKKKAETSTNKSARTTENNENSTLTAI